MGLVEGVVNSRVRLDALLRCGDASCQGNEGCQRERQENGSGGRGLSFHGVSGGRGRGPPQNLEQGSGGVTGFSQSFGRGILTVFPRYRLHSESVEDDHGHRVNYLRISITDRCNERCRYCMPDEMQDWLPGEEVLRFDEILRTVKVATGLGIDRVRITGGEPLTRPGALDFIRELAALPQLKQVGISTNGSLLSRECREDLGKTVAAHLYDSGVASVNVSLDSLNRSVYRDMTGRDFLPRVLDGFSAAKEAGFESVRINCVLMRGQNEDKLCDLIDFAYARDLLLRFIELMPVSSEHVLTEENFLAAGSARKIIEKRFGPLRSMPEFRTNGPASYFEIEGREQRIGVIGAMTNLKFCESCNKLRLTCDGKLRPCLGDHLEFDLKNVLRSKDCSDEMVASFFHDVVAKKPREHGFRENYKPGRKMIAIGG